jgi:hypothetical protein
VATLDISTRVFTQREFTRKLLAYRAEHALSLKDLSELFGGVPASTLNSWIGATGIPSEELYARVSEIMGIETPWAPPARGVQPVQRGEKTLRDVGVRSAVDPTTGVEIDVQWNWLEFDEFMDDFELEVDEVAGELGVDEATVKDWTQPHGAFPPKELGEVLRKLISCEITFDNLKENADHVLLED